MLLKFNYSYIVWRGEKAYVNLLPFSQNLMLLLQDTLNKVAVSSITHVDDAKKVLSLTFIFKYIFLSFKSTAILLSGKVLSWKGFKNVAFPYVSGKKTLFMVTCQTV